MKIKVLHIIGGSPSNGSFKGATILHKALSSLDVDSYILNDTSNYKDQKLITQSINNISFINKEFKKKIFYKVWVFFEKIFKLLLLHSPRETFTFGILGFDLTKTEEYNKADIIHIHWINQGFISLKSLRNIKKPTIWTMRSMWAFTGGAHYEMDFKNYENSFLSKIIRNYKLKSYKENFHFIAVSKWLEKKAKKSYVLKNKNVLHINNNVDIEKFKIINKDEARAKLGINTSKKIILYGAQNPQSTRKGWKIFRETLKLIDKSKYFLIIFGSFWSHNEIKEIGLEYKSLGFIKESFHLSQIYSAADIFVASSIQDAWPKTFAEAMYCGTPVVCFNKTSISEIVDHKVNGYVVDDFDALSLKDGIDWLSDQVIKKTLRPEKIQGKILNYSPEKIGLKYVELYKKILSSES